MSEYPFFGYFEIRYFHMWVYIDIWLNVMLKLFFLEKMFKILYFIYRTKHRGRGGGGTEGGERWC